MRSSHSAVRAERSSRRERYEPTVVYQLAARLKTSGETVDQARGPVDEYVEPGSLSPGSANTPCRST